MIVELRAIWSYRLYHDVLAEQEAGISLKSVLADEELHLPQMSERLNRAGRELNRARPPFARLEDKLFRNLWQNVEAGNQLH